MRIHIEWLQDGARNAARRDDVIVVIDALRSAALIVTALSKGIEKVFLTENIHEALKIKSMYGNDMLIAGEGVSMPIEGFEVGNSPIKLLNVLDRRRPKYMAIITEATSGTRTVDAIFSENSSATVFVGSPLNASSVAKVAEEYAEKLEKDITLVCSGYLGKEFALEDFMTAGLIAKRFKNIESYDDNVLAAMIIAEIFEKDKDHYMLYQEQSKSYKRLSSLGSQEDIEYCLREDIYETTPYAVYEVTRGTRIIYFTRFE
ncbi:MAG: hypothetical protein DRN30_01205 [Thermoplasmata archaeon]|nr:MAG: hypothetical protein DRN30_01205 [Thermoplasmata archaeon]